MFNAEQKRRMVLQEKVKRAQEEEAKVRGANYLGNCRTQKQNLDICKASQNRTFRGQPGPVPRGALIARAQIIHSKEKLV